MEITIYIICFNESVLLPFALKWYRDRFPAAKFVIYDNHSTDNTKTIAEESGCTIVPFDTNNQISDMMYLRIKDNCWKSAETSWVIVCDADELLEITEEQLRAEDNMFTTVIKAEGYNMINLNDDLNIAGIDRGIRADYRFYDKTLLFKKSVIQEINYNVGAHMCRPVGEVRYSSNTYRMLHYNNLSPDYKVARYKMYAERLSEDNKINSYGGQYLHPEGAIRSEFEHNRNNAIKLL